jgi:hypothetical protein
MTDIYSFAKTRTVMIRRQQLSYVLAHFARALTVCACLGAWALVCVAVLNAGPILVITIVAVFSTLVSIPLFVITNAQIRVQGRRRHHVVAHT